MNQTIMMDGCTCVCSTIKQISEQPTLNGTATRIAFTLAFLIFILAVYYGFRKLREPPTEKQYY